MEESWTPLSVVRGYSDDRERVGSTYGLVGYTGAGWDYEQPEGYRPSRIVFSHQTPYHRFAEELHGDPDLYPDYDEVGVWPEDLSDELEDWDLSPMGRTRHRGYWDWEGDCQPYLISDPSLEALYTADEIEIIKAERARAAKRQREVEAFQEREAIVKMRHASRDRATEKAKAGTVGEFQIQVRLGNQTLLTTYRAGPDPRWSRPVVVKETAGWVDPRDRR